ncbi:hypothetical protein SEA_PHRAPPUCCINO_99 [Mycobacterium phage Phrappuccino]|uniref:Uncharacterized protein n=1 Tax=Mycobacterium phage Phrappuccino TaxID=2591223 RepID=A0A514DDT8_9CAUD|nr:hypothetical protein KHQ87_gp099 [Mycobacterium phage Phrappuccino]QDH91774.1 hypothetical protein SEA_PHRAPPUCCINO_99 [Mycobacterium phage Phrappuccino]QIQ63216.1 hypothetical protein SEA_SETTECANDELA_99 [Mycobacterium phage Settecandela]
MKVKNADIWQQQRAELLADGEIGPRFLEILEAWAESAEELMEGVVPVRDAAMSALGGVEERFGRVNIVYLGQMLTLLTIFWAHGDEFAEELSAIELRLVQDLTAQKILELSAEAATDTEGDIGLEDASNYDKKGAI